MRPWAVSVRISRRSSSWWRTLVDTWSSTSADVRARLALELGDERHLRQVGAVHAVGGDAQRLVEGHAEALVGERAPELRVRRLRCTVDGDAERSDEAVAGAERGRDDVERLGQLLAEVPAAPWRPAA